MVIFDFFAGIFFASIFLFSCGKQDGAKSQGPTLGGQELLLLESSELALSGDSLSGKGRFVFVQPIGAIDSNRNFSLQFSLKPAGILTFFSFADADLKRGISLEFRREPKSLSSSVHIDQTSAAKSMTKLDLDSRLSVSIDIHNGENPVHVLVWPSTETNPNDDNALLNSDADGELRGRGTDVFWGFELQDAQLHSASLGEAVFGH